MSDTASEGKPDPHVWGVALGLPIGAAGEVLGLCLNVWHAEARPPAGKVELRERREKTREAAFGPMRALLQPGSFSIGYFAREREFLTLYWALTRLKDALTPGRSSQRRFEVQVQIAGPRRLVLVWYESKPKATRTVNARRGVKVPRRYLFAMVDFTPPGGVLLEWYAADTELEGIAQKAEALVAAQNAQAAGSAKAAILPVVDHMNKILGCLGLQVSGTPEQGIFGVRQAWEEIEANLGTAIIPDDVIRCMRIVSEAMRERGVVAPAMFRNEMAALSLVMAGYQQGLLLPNIAEGSEG